MFEYLETRQLLSSSLSNGLLTVTGTGSADTISLSVNGSKIKVTQTGASAKNFTTNDVKKILIDAQGGNDTVTVSDSINKPCTISGGNGKDTITSGSGDDLIDGGDGNDQIKGGKGNDTLKGGKNAGADALFGQDGDDDLDGGNGNDFFDGGKGTDSVDYSSRTVNNTAIINFDPNAYVAKGHGGATGTGENDTYNECENLLGGGGIDKFTFDCNQQESLSSTLGS